MDKGAGVDIKMVEIDLDSLVDVEQVLEAVEFEIKLSEVPHREWVEEFEYLYRHEPHIIKPPVEIDGDTMRIQFLPRYDDELQGLLDFIGDLCCRATEEARLTIAIQTTEEQENRKREFRQFLTTVKLPGC